MECPYCNGTGHHNYKDCIKCDGTGDYTPTLSKSSKTNKASLKSIALYWLGFFAVTLLLVYAVIFFKEIGIVYEVTLIALSIASWFIIYLSIQKIVLNSRKIKHERLVFYDHDKSLLSNIFGFIFIITLATPIITLAFLPFLWLTKY